MGIKIEVKDLEELFKIVEKGQSVRVTEHYTTKRLDGDKNPIKYEDRIWQLEKQEEKYCFKTFDGYGRAKKVFFERYEEFTERGTSECSHAAYTAYIYISEHIKITPREYIEFIKGGIDYQLNEFTQEKRRPYYTGRENSKIIIDTFKTKSLLKCGNKNGENEIRVVLNDYVANAYTDYALHEEYSTLALQSRADTVVITNEDIHVYEIKSKGDSFTRLEKQIEDYRKYATRITIVLDESKVNLFLKKYRHLYKDLGLLVYKKDSDKLLHKYKSNKLIPTTDRLALLWSEELYNLIYFIDNKNINRMSVNTKCKLASHIYTKQQALHLTHKIMFSRFKTRKQNGAMVKGSVDIREELFLKYNKKQTYWQEKANRYKE